MFYSFKWWYKRRQRILAARRGRGDVEKAHTTPLEKLAAALQLKNKGGSSTGSSSSSGKFTVQFFPVLTAAFVLFQLCYTMYKLASG